MANTQEDARRELSMTFAIRPQEGTERENRAWVNGFREALEAVDDGLGTAFVKDVLGLDAELVPIERSHEGWDA